MIEWETAWALVTLVIDILWYLVLASWIHAAKQREKRRLAKPLIKVIRDHMFQSLLANVWRTKL